MLIKCSSKRVISIILILSILITSTSINASSNSSTIISKTEVEDPPIISIGDKDLNFKEEMAILKSKDIDADNTISENHIASLNSLVDQLEKKEVDIWFPMDYEVAISPSGIDHRIRMSYEIVYPIYANYESEETAKVKFNLNGPSEHQVSFNYKIYSGSAIYGEHFDGTTEGTIIFEIGETEKQLDIDIRKLVNNPTTEYELPSSPSEFWTKDRMLFINCNDITNALFDNENESITIPVTIENEFNFIQSYENARDSYLLDLSNLSGVEYFPETPGKFINTEDQIILGEELTIDRDIRTMIDTNVFSHINMPIGYFSNDSTTTGGITFKIDNTKRGESNTVFQRYISIEDEEEIDFNLGTIEISEIGLGSYHEGNAMVQSLSIMFDYSGVTESVYTCFNNQDGDFVEKQMNFIDEIHPFVEDVIIPDDDFFYGENIPVTIIYSEPVLVDDISIKANGNILYPMENKGTISNRVSFLYQIEEGFSDLIEVTDITGAIDLSGKTQDESYDRTLTDARLTPFDPEKSLTYFGDTTVNIEEKGEIVLSIRENNNLSNWFVERIQGDELIPNVKARVIGKEGDPIDVELYGLNDGIRITQLKGIFDAPANLLDGHNYVAEIYFAEDILDGFRLLYGLSSEYAVAPIVYIDDEADLEIVYDNWPLNNQIYANNETPISLEYNIKNNATWKEAENFSWSSTDESIATIKPTGEIALTGKMGEVTFTLTALNDGLPENKFSIYSKTLEVLDSKTTFLNTPESVKNIEIIKGNDAKVYYSTNLTETNDLYAGAGAITTYSYDLYESKYESEELQRGNLVDKRTFDATVDKNIFSYTIPAEYLVNTSVRGKYGYILEISAKDLLADKILSTTANICVKELPAKAILNKPEDYYLTDEVEEIKVQFDIDNKNANTEYRLSLIKNNEETSNISDVNGESTVTITPVESDRLLDVYAISLKAKNEFDETYSYDSYNVYVYNSNALKIMVNGNATDNLNMSINDELSTMTSKEILALNRKINLTEDITINNKEYKWSYIADKITWKVIDDNKISLRYNDKGIYRNIEDYPQASFLPDSEFLLQGKSSGESIVTATHGLTGMETELNVTVDKIEEKLYLFQTYPEHKCEVSYTNGENIDKTIQTNDNGRLAVYEESGIKSDVTFQPNNLSIYDYGVIKNNDLVANQKNKNNFELYPEQIVKLPLAQYKVTILLFQEEKNGDIIHFDGDVTFKGGVYKNGVYCPNAKINGISGKTKQIISTDEYGAYVLNFDPKEFKTGDYDNILQPKDNIDYAIEISLSDNPYETKIIKIDSQKIKQYRYYKDGVYLLETIKKINSSKLQSNLNIVSQTLTMDGIEEPMMDMIIFEDLNDTATINTELIFTGDNNSYYEVEFEDKQNQWNLFSDTVKESYEFSNVIRLKNTFDIKKRLLYMKPGEKSELYMKITTKTDDNLREIKLPKPINIQKLVNIPKMDTLGTRDLNEIEKDITQTISGPFLIKSIDNDNIGRTLNFLRDYNINTSSIRLEIEPTNDPLVYKGIIKFAAGGLTPENPSGVYMVNDKGTSSTFNFTPGLSDIKSIKKGDYIQKSKKQMDKNKSGASDIQKTYGGGAYLECEIYYDIDSRKWNIIVLKSDVHLGAGGGYYRTFNTWVGPVPVTAEFRTGLTAQIGLKTIANKIYLDENEEEYNIARDYITELHPHFYIYGFGGFGQDYIVASLKVGLYGQINLDQRYLWLNQKNVEKNGQKIAISGETGVKFQASVLFINYTKKYQIAEASKSWTYNDFDEIDDIFNSKSNKRNRSLLFNYSDDDGYIVLEPVSETATVEDRSYLNTFERYWNTSKFKSFSMEDITTIQTNAYPNSNPMLTDDGMIMVYISDMDSMDINKTSVSYSKKDVDGSFGEGEAIYPSSNADTDLAIDGTGDDLVVSWTRVMTDLDEINGEEVTSEDLHNMMASTEIMASVYNGTNFITKQLTEDSTPDLSPVVATNGNKAIVAWRSLYASDRDDPLDFDGRDNIMYSIFNGTNWSEAKCLYDGSTDKVKTLSVKMLSDGTAGITYQISKNNTEDTEIFCAVLDKDGNIINNIRLTKDESKNENPRITSVVFPDKVERFVIGWNMLNTINDVEEENIIRISALDNQGRLYPQFEKEIRNTSDISNYSGFKFTKGAETLGDLSIIWTEPNADMGIGAESIYKDIIWGMKFIEDKDGKISESPKIKLLELDDHNVVDFFDSYVDNNTKETNFSLLITDHNNIKLQSKLAIAKSSYKNSLVVDEVYFSSDDVLPGLDMPILFSLYNDSAEPINKITINIGGQNFELDEGIFKPGEYKNFTVLYNLPQTIVNLDYSITAEFLTSTNTKEGTLKLDVPDIGIYQIDITKEIGRERMFNIQLHNNTFAKLVEGKHKVEIQVYDTPDFDNTPILNKTISDAESLYAINNGILMQDIILSEEDLAKMLDDKGEIPKEGVRIYFNVLMEENGVIIDDSDISNDTDYVKIHSLLTKSNDPVSISSIMIAESNNTTVQVDALNNSMNGLNNGNIIVNIRDEYENIIETQQTYNATDKDRSLITLEGEEKISTTFNFKATGASSDAIFSRVQENILLSKLNFTGIALNYNKNIFNYNLQVVDLSKTFITMATEDPDSIVTVFKDGKLISVSEPCTLEYGENIFEIVVKTNTVEVKYKITIRNIKSSDNEPSEDKDDTNSGSDNESSKDNGDTNSNSGGKPIKPATTEWQNPFTDVFENEWFYEAVKFVKENGFMKGVSETEFGPNLKLTRGMFVTILYRMEKEPDTDEYNFNDVDKDKYYEKAIAWAANKGIVKGISETEFGPNNMITREQMAAIIYRYIKFKGDGPTDLWYTEMNYSDLDQISDYAREAIMFCKLRGIMVGNPNNEFLPQGDATRAETASVIQRIIGINPSSILR